MFQKIYFLFILMLGIQLQVSAQNVDSLKNDSTITLANTIQDSISKPKKVPYAGVRQWRISTDLARIGFNIADPSRQTYEIQLDYKDTDKRYWTAEAGYGRGNIDYSYLSYTSNSSFLKIGLDNSMFKSMSSRDFDIVYLGIRYAMAYGTRQEATYSFDSPFGGTFEGTAPSESFFVHWGEITLGMRLEVWKRVFLGWTGRAKFMFNAGRFESIKPNHIAGYGSADNATSFDINLYLSYAFLRYQKQ